MNNLDEALQAYNKAYEILTEHDNPTDPPSEPRYVLSQLQYRIGLCLSQESNRKCATTDDPQTEVSCREMAAHAFSKAVEFDSNNLQAKHMLASITADATMKRADNSYVKDLFDQYAQNFEHSLVEELGYDGYARLRRGFDRAFGGEANLPKFDVVVDAGCGTGLVGEQVRILLFCLFEMRYWLTVITTCKLVPIVFISFILILIVFTIRFVATQNFV